MPIIAPMTILIAIAGLLCVPTAQAAEPYIAFGVGYGEEEIGAGANGVNHPTRCDSLLYSDPAAVPSDAACTDSTPKQFVQGSFDLGGAFVGMAAFGYAWDRLRIEAELSSRGHGSDTLPAIASAGNVALVDKNSEWSEHSPPHHRVSGFRAQQLFLNLYYTFDLGSRWTPYIGAGAGFARVNGDYFLSFIRRTVADGYVAAAGGDPTAPADWQLAAAGTDSVLEVGVSETAFGYQISAGAERALSDAASIFLLWRWMDFEQVSSTDVWSTIRSHAPVRSDGVTPFTTDQTFSDIGGWVAGAGLRYAF